MTSGTYWYATDRRGLFDAPGPRRAVVLYLGWVTVFATLYYLADGHMRRDPARWVRDFAGLPAFLFGLNLVWSGLRRATTASSGKDAP